MVKGADSFTRRGQEKKKPRTRGTYGRVGDEAAERASALCLVLRFIEPVDARVEGDGARTKDGYLHRNKKKGRDVASVRSGS